MSCFAVNRGQEISTRDMQKMVQALPQYREVIEKLGLHIHVVFNEFYILRSNRRAKARREKKILSDVLVTLKAVDLSFSQMGPHYVQLKGSWILVSSADCNNTE